MIGIYLVVSSAIAAGAETTEWVLKADYVDACSCDMTCPCIFGGSPTHGFCKGATLVEFEEGRYGNVDVSGVTVLAIYDGGKWIKFFVSENATREQTDTVVEFLPAAERFFEGPVIDVRNVPISVVRTDDRIKITTEGTVIELEQVRNAAGDPIKVLNLPAKGFPAPPYLDHTQYKTVVLKHESENENYSFSGTNGYTAVIETSSDAETHAMQSDVAMAQFEMAPDTSLHSGMYCQVP